MEVNTMDVLFFGDQTGLSLEFLVDSLRRTKEFPLSAAFAEGTAKTLRYEIAELSKAERESLPGFSTLPELAERLLKENLKHPALDSALLSISQFVHLFG